MFDGKGVFSEKDALSIAMKLCQILIDLHDLKPAMIHRDIKPSNVMLLSDGTVKLLDFNAAKLENTDGSRDTVLLGTAGFAAPEQYGFSASSRQTDIYAVGVLLNTMLTGTLPAEKIAGGKLWRIIRCCLELNPKDRYRDMRELYSELKRMSKVKAEWLPPGFRTLRVHKMLPALAVYVGLFWFFMTFEYKSIEEPGEEIVIKCGFIAVFYLTIFFYGNYLNMKKYFPFMRSPKKSLRIFGRILAPFLIAWVVFMVAVTIVVLFVQ